MVSALNFIHLPDVDGYLVELDGERKGVIDQEDLDDCCPLWKDLERDGKADGDLYAEIEPYLHEPATGPYPPLS
jgi:hypothetical protein